MLPLENLNILKVRNVDLGILVGCLHNTNAVTPKLEVIFFGKSPSPIRPHFWAPPSDPTSSPTR